MTNAEFKKLDTAARREIILNTAARLFATKGYDVVTTLELSEAIGCTETMLLNIFPSKNELYDTLFKEWYIIVQQKMTIDIINNSVLDSLEKFYNDQLILTLSRSHDMRPHLELALLSRKSDGSRKKIIEVLNNAPDYVTHTIEPIIKIGQQNGEIVEGNPNDLATLFWTILLGARLLKENYATRHPAPEFNDLRKIFQKPL